MTGSQQFAIALATEWMKFRRAPVVIVTTALLLLGVMAICGATIYGVQSGNSQLIAKAGPLAAAGGWAGLFSVANQIVPTAGMLAFGVVIGWVFGREFTDGTVIGLFARPVSRTAIAAAKLLLVLLWVVTCSFALVGLVLAMGSVLSVGHSDSATAGLAVKLGIVGLLTGMLASVAGLVGTLARGYLPAIGATIGLVVITVVATILGAGGWFPFAAPGLWAVATDAVPDGVLTIQLVLVLPFWALMVMMTLRAWNRLRL